MGLRVESKTGCRARSLSLYRVSYTDSQTAKVYVCTSQFTSPTFLLSAESFKTIFLVNVIQWNSSLSCSLTVKLISTICNCLKRLSSFKCFQCWFCSRF
jgi:hypothetical protein